MKRAKGRVLLDQAEALALPPSKTKTSSKKPASPTPAVERAQPRTAPVKRSSEPPPIAAIDRKNARKIRIGRIEIEARIDLHGMRQDEAHAALRAFLFRCQTRQLRYVLVITGKGKTTGPAEHGGMERERGILKRNVPRWLDEPELRAIVVGYTVAAIQHGGEGAIYVHVRSNGRS
nr:Smr/MutS family protein [Hyphomicrobium methylovorum]